MVLVVLSTQSGHTVRIAKVPRFLPNILFSFILVVSHGQVSANDHGSNANIKGKVDHYLAKIFGERQPTLADFYRYENVHSEWEGIEEDKYCLARWGGIQTEGCKAWVTDRSNTPKKFESLFYKRVRKLVHLNLKLVKTLEVNCDKSKSGDYCKIDVISGNTGPSLSLKLVNDPRIPDLAYLRIRKIDGKPIDQYFK